MSAKLKDGVITIFEGSKDETKFEIQHIPISLHARLAGIAVQRISREMTAGKSDDPETREKAKVAIQQFWNRVIEGKLDTEKPTKSAVVSVEEIEQLYMLAIVGARVEAEQHKIGGDKKYTAEKATAAFLALPPKRQNEIKAQFTRQVKSQVRTLIMARTSKTDY